VPPLQGSLPLGDSTPGSRCPDPPLPLRVRISVHPGLFSRRAYGARTFITAGAFSSGQLTVVSSALYSCSQAKKVSDIRRVLARTKKRADSPSTPVLHRKIWGLQPRSWEEGLSRVPRNRW
jgi:hypothetical protein